ncbi:hypothetical protein [Ferrimicrobium sp.]|uniref:hypothetical protein n=1 Tax=Ferrimicrobium sp. TaxID=2926050 RepID=UPI00262B3893|nr:hypothetical protein [Ferrimicrobium sp.]
MYPKQEQCQTTTERAAFWEVLERTAALAEPKQEVKLPELVDLVPDVSPSGPGDTRVVESDSQLPREVYEHIRGLLGDVEATEVPVSVHGVEGVIEKDLAINEATAAEDGGVTNSSTVESELEQGQVQQDPLQQQSVQQLQVQRAQAEQREHHVATVTGPTHVEPGPTGSSLEAVEPVATQPISGGLGPMYEFGAHAAVIPGTEEFMSSLARKNRAFEHTGEIDTDLDRAADKLGWNRTDDDVVAKRKIFKKKKRF